MEQKAEDPNKLDKFLPKTSGQCGVCTGQQAVGSQKPGVSLQHELFYSALPD
jgi:hypothetical protein